MREKQAVIFFFAEKNMAFRSFLAGIAGVLLATGCGSSGKSAGKSADNIPVQPPVTLTHTTAAPVVVDGDISDWHVPVAFSDHSTGISLSLQADSANLYIAMHVINQATQMKMLQMGMQVYLDTSEQKSQAVFVAYPVRGELQYTQDQNNSDPLQQHNRSDKQQLIKRAIMMQTRGLNNFRDGMHMKKNADGPTIALGEDGNNNLVYEAAIPLKQVLGNDFHYTSETALNIGCKISGFDKTDDKSKRDFTESFSGGQQGFGGRRNGYNRSARDNYADMMNIHKDVVFWIKALLH